MSAKFWGELGPENTERVMFDAEGGDPEGVWYVTIVARTLP